MPTYDYVCLNCGKKFSVHMTIGEHEKRKAKCPGCGGRKSQHQMAAFFAITAKKR